MVRISKKSSPVSKVVIVYHTKFTLQNQTKLHDFVKL